LKFLAFISSENVGLAGRHTPPCLRGASAGNRTLIAVQAEVMLILQVKRPVPKRCTAFDTCTASDTQFFIDSVFKIGNFNKIPRDCIGRAELAFRPCISVPGPRLKITAAQVTISTHREGMDTLYGRLRENTIDGAFFALDTDVGI